MGVSGPFSVVVVEVHLVEMAYCSKSTVAVAYDVACVARAETTPGMSRRAFCTVVPVGRINDGGEFVSEEKRGG